MNIQAARARFPGLEDKVFLDAACVSLMSMDTRDAVARFLDMALACPARDASIHHIAMDKIRGETSLEVARLLHASPRNVALVESTTQGLNLAAQAIGPEPGSNVLVADTEFMQVSIPWKATNALKNVEIRPVRSQDGGVLTVDAFERVMDERTRAVCVSSVQWCTGVRLDMRALGELCRARGIWLVADAVQEIGAMHVDVRDRYADFLIAGGHKWLNAPFGCGLMVLSDRVLSELTPPCHGYLSMEEPEGGWGQYFRTPSISPYSDYRFVREARAFETGGTSNYPGAAGLGASLRMVNELGTTNVEAHIHALTERLREGLRSAGARVLGSDDPATRSGITVFRYFEDPARDQALVEQFLDDKILVSMRFTSGVGGIRVSTHYFNSEEDVDRLLAALRRLSA